MRHSDSIAEIATALAAAQGAFPPIPKDRTVTVKMRSGGQYTFAYAPLDTIIDKTRKPLADNGLAITQGVVTDEKGTDYMRTLLTHKSGEWLLNETPMFTAGGENASQGFASGMTYARRYGYSAMLCLAADDDDDGNGNEDGERSSQAQRQPQQNARPAQPKAKPAGNKPQLDEQAEGINGLSEGQRKLLMVKARNAGYPDESALLERHPRIHPGNINEILDALKVEAEKADAGA